jgi:hypothetical protein
MLLSLVRAMVGHASHLGAGEWVASVMLALVLVAGILPALRRA